MKFEVVTAVVSVMGFDVVAVVYT